MSTKEDNKINMDHISDKQTTSGILPTVSNIIIATKSETVEVTRPCKVWVVVNRKVVVVVIVARREATNK